MDIFETKLYKLNDNIKNMNDIYKFLVDKNNNIIDMSFFTKLKLNEDSILELKRSLNLNDIFEEVKTILVNKYNYEILTNNKIPIVNIETKELDFELKKIILYFDNITYEYFSFDKKRITDINKVLKYILSEDNIELDKKKCYKYKINEERRKVLVKSLNI